MRAWLREHYPLVLVVVGGVALWVAAYGQNLDH